MPLKDITNQKFGKLTVIKRGENTPKGLATWICQCDCGNIVNVRGSDLRKGHTKSCGCASRNFFAKVIFKHGFCGTRLHKIWWNIQDRCYNPKVPNYYLYGGRGVKMCQEWLDDFLDFRNWAMANGYDDTLTIDRIDVNGNYEPSNCRWITYKAQNRNKRTNRIIKYDNKEMCLSDWAKELNVDRKTLSDRLKKGWSIQKAFSTPVKKYKICHK